MLTLLRNLALEKLIPFLQARLRGFVARQAVNLVRQGEVLLMDAMEGEAEIEDLEEAIHDARDLLGDGNRSLFPGLESPLMRRAVNLRDDLQKWVEMEEELETMEEDPRPSDEAFFDMVGLLKRCEELAHIPTTYTQERLVDDLRERISDCSKGNVEVEAGLALQELAYPRLKNIAEESERMFKGEAMPEVLQQVVDMLAAFEELRRDAEKARKELNMPLIEHVLRRADRTFKGYRDEEGHIFECERLSKLPLLLFVQMEMDLAIAEGDDVRRIHREIKLQELTLDQAGSKYSPFEDYRGLRSAELYAKSSWHYRLWGYQRLVESMMVHSTKGLPTSLTTMGVSRSATLANQVDEEIPDLEPSEVKRFTKVAQQCYKLLLGYCGDARHPLAAKNPDEAAKKILDLGLEYPVLRNELYAQCIKQLSHNEHIESMYQAEEFLGFLCSTFPPSLEMENWILMFLRHRFQAEPKRLRKYVSALHSSKYGSKGNTKTSKSVVDLREEFKVRTASRFSVTVAKEGERTKSDRIKRMTSGAQRMKSMKF